MLHIQALTELSSLAGIRQWGLSQGNQISPATVSLPITYTNKQVCAMAIDWGASGKAYGVAELNTTTFTVVAPKTTFSVYWASVGQ